MGQKVNPLGFRLGVSQKHISHWFVNKNKYSQLVVEDQFIRNFFMKKFPSIASINIKRDLNKIEIEIFSANTRDLLIEGSKENYAAPSGINEKKLTDTNSSEEGGLRGTKNSVNSTAYPINNLCDQLLKKLTIYRNTQFLKNTLKSKIRTNNKEFASNNSSNVSNDNKPFFGSKEDFGIDKKPIEIALFLTKVENPNTSAACIADFIVEQLEKRVPFRRVLKRSIQKAEESAVEGIKVQISGRLNGAEIARSERIHKGQVPLHTLRAKIEYNSRSAKTIYGLLGVKVWVFNGFADLNEAKL